VQTEHRTRYLSAAETAKHLRADLKRRFPGTRFSVRTDTYSGGASIRVKWVDGPGQKTVEAVANSYRGSDFDGMIDMKSGREHWLLPDGTLKVAEIRGTEGSRGSLPGAVFAPPHPDAVPVSLLADFVFCDRYLSEERCRALAHAALCHFGWKEGEHYRVVVRYDGQAYVDTNDWDLQRCYHQAFMEEV